MQPAHQQPVLDPIAAGGLPRGPLSPSAMAQTLRRAGGEAALCFARTMLEDAAWANDAWGEYWASVVRAV